MKYFKALLALTLALASFGAQSQYMYGNTFPFWTVVGNTTSGSLVVNGTSTFTGAVSVVGGVTGTVTADSAVTGTVGQFVTSTVTSGAAVSHSTTVQANVTSISLTAGDWDVSAQCNTLGSTMIATVMTCGLGTTSATQLTQAGGNGVGTDPLFATTFASQTLPNQPFGMVIPPVRVSIAATTTIYLVVKNTWSSGTAATYGTLRARRMR